MPTRPTLRDWALYGAAAEALLASGMALWALADIAAVRP
jgi:hypothetical protein